MRPLRLSARAAAALAPAIDLDDREAGRRIAVALALALGLVGLALAGHLSSQVVHGAWNDLCGTGFR